MIPSLTLFSPARYSSLPGMPFPGADRDRYPHRDEVVDHLTAYADRLAADIRTGRRVTPQRAHQQPQKAKRPTDSVGGPSRKIEVRTGGRVPALLSAPGAPACFGFITSGPAARFRVVGPFVFSMIGKGRTTQGPSTALLQSGVRPS